MTCNNDIQCNHCSEKWVFMKAPFQNYKISNKGRIIHVSKNHRIYNVKPRIQKTPYNRYVVVAMNYWDEEGKVHYTKRGLAIMVAENFVENPCNYKTVRHKNYDVTDNRAENLAWVKEKGYRYKRIQNWQK